MSNVDTQSLNLIPRMGVEPTLDPQPVILSYRSYVVARREPPRGIKIRAPYVSDW